MGLLKGKLWRLQNHQKKWKNHIHKLSEGDKPWQQIFTNTEKNNN